MGWRNSGRLAGKSTTAGPESSAGSGGCGETRPRHRSRSHGRHPGFQKLNSARLLKRNVEPGSIVYTDGLKSFTGLHEAGYKHVPRTQPLRIDLRKGAKSVVPLADRAIGNLQQWLIGTYHGVSRDQLQVYLDEFVFRHNRRRLLMAAFQTLLGLGAGRKPTAYNEIRGAADLSRSNPKVLGSAETTG